MNNSNQPYNKEYRRLLRHDMTPSEKMLWKHISDKQLDGWRFRRQHGFGPYVLDFYCPVLKLCIEVDGEIHQRTDVVEKDKERTSFLESNGIKVIRFTNDEIENDISDVLERIRRFINNNSFNLRFQKK
ncbi:MAG: endonuclease domain-containing protein [Prevotellaceae bacterium]|nr:endonuclease domain-containing protein [Prevotellaceae bacterium]